MVQTWFKTFETKYTSIRRIRMHTKLNDIPKYLKDEKFHVFLDLNKYQISLSTKSGIIDNVWRTQLLTGEEKNMKKSILEFCAFRGEKNFQMIRKNNYLDDEG